MAFVEPQWGFGASPETIIPFAPQPNVDPGPLLVGRRGQTDGGEFVNGLDGLRLGWGAGGQGTLSHAEYIALVDIWATVAKPNAGRGYLSWFNDETDDWQIDYCIMRRPVGIMMGHDGDGPRRRDVVAEFRSIGLQEPS